jgi:hypothetical protein
MAWNWSITIMTTNTNYKIFYGVLRGPPWALKRPKNLKISKSGLKMGIVKLYFVITTKI